MIDYKKMYIILCDAISESLDKMPPIIDNFYVHRRLTQALQDAEEVYVQTADLSEDTASSPGD